MPTKKQTMAQLIKPEFGYLVFQKLLAELVYETQRNTKTQSLDARYETLLKVLLGKKTVSVKRAAYTDDTKKLCRAAVMIKHFKLTLSEATTEVARQEWVPGYKFRSNLPKNIDCGLKQQIASTKRRLTKKLKDNVDKYAKEYRYQEMAEEVRITKIFEEVKHIASLIPNWLESYGETFQAILDEKSFAEGEDDQ